MSDATLAVLEMALDPSTEEPMALLRCWMEGDFETIRKEWPGAPEAIFIGADPSVSGSSEPTELERLREAVERALVQISGGLCYFTVEGKHAQLKDAQKTLRDALGGGR